MFNRFSEELNSASVALMRHLDTIESFKHQLDELYQNDYEYLNQSIQDKLSDQNALLSFYLYLP